MALHPITITPVCRSLNNLHYLTYTLCFLVVYEVELNADAIDTLDGVTNPDHTVTVTCEDSAGGTTSADVLVTVTPNMAPTVDALPDHIEVSENQVVELEIWTLAYTDAETDTVTCDIASNPAGGPFDLREAGLGTPNGELGVKIRIYFNNKLEYQTIMCCDFCCCSSSPCVL